LRKLAEAAGKLTISFEQMIETLRGSIRSILDSVKPEVKSLQTLINPTQENLRASVNAILESTKPAQNALENLTNPSEENLRRTIADSLAAAKPTVDMLNLLTSGALAQRTSSNAPMDVRLTIDGGSDKLSQAIAESIQLATRSGYSTVPNGFLV
jgi:methyl-accepting chemotaxis protein